MAKLEERGFIEKPHSLYMGHFMPGNMRYSVMVDDGYIQYEDLGCETSGVRVNFMTYL